MAHFYASIQGNKGEATRMGTKDSGIRGHIHGWDIGCEVLCTYNPRTDEDEVTIYLTSGSRGYHPKIHLGTFTQADLAQTRKRGAV